LPFISIYAYVKKLGSQPTNLLFPKGGTLEMKYIDNISITKRQLIKFFLKFVSTCLIISVLQTLQGCSTVVTTPAGSFNSTVGKEGVRVEVKTSASPSATPSPTDQSKSTDGGNKGSSGSSTQIVGSCSNAVEGSADWKTWNCVKK
jgi:hypothetical protein